MGLWVVIWALPVFGVLTTGAAGGDPAWFIAGGLGGLVFALFGLATGVAMLLLGRVFLECIVVAFRIAETLGEINAKTR